MNNEEIIEILDRWNFWNRDIDSGIERRTYLDKLERLSGTGQVVAITGARRCGKSTLMKQAIKRKIAAGTDRRSILYVNLEEPKFSGLLSLEFLQQIHDAYIEILRPGDKPWIFLDEVQRIEGWEKFVRGLHEKNEAHIVVSGSTVSILSKELGTLLTGRWLELKTYPLDFKEYLLFKQLTIEDQLDMLSKKTQIKQYLREYLEFGGFPLTVLKEEKEEILKRYFEDIVERDISLRNNIRKPEKLKLVVRYYLTNYSSRISYRKIAGFTGLSPSTVERFSEYMEEAYLIFFVPRFSWSLKDQAVNQKTVYCIDSGLINTIGFRFTDNIGKLYENLVSLALKMNEKDIYYYKTDKSECDILIKERQKITSAIQVSYEVKENREREIRGLMDAMKAFDLKEGTIITQDDDREEIIDKRKVIYRPLWKWLLESGN